MTETAAAAPPSRAYRRYVLGMLIAVYAVNFVDRTILGALGEPIKRDLGLADWQLGVLGGLAFAILYSILGVPIARLAERVNRVGLMSAAIAVWSVMTALCAGAMSFGHLALARIGVGIGEAGCVPPAASLIADYFPPRERATAAGLFAIGVPLGTVAGAIIGALVAEHYGWRAAFLVVGVPGVLLALAFRLTVREPVRGGLDPAGDAEETPSLREVVRTLLNKPTFIHICIGSTVASFGGYAIAAFAIPFLLRGFPLSLTEASALFGVLGGGSAAVGVALGGFVADKAGRKDPRYYALIPAAGFMLAAPLYMLAFTRPTLLGIALVMIPPLVMQYIYLGPLTGLCQNMVAPRARATTQALLTLVINLFGLSLGPTLVGWASDLYAAGVFTGAAGFQSACPGGQAPAGSTAQAVQACRTASFVGLQRALVTASGVYLWAGLHFFLAARHVARDLRA
jgi:predicted MFS family arabinose efflux permease